MTHDAPSLVPLTKCLDGTCCPHEWHLAPGYRTDVVTFCIHNPSDGAIGISLMEPAMRALHQALTLRLQHLELEQANPFHAGGKPPCGSM